MERDKLHEIHNSIFLICTERSLLSGGSIQVGINLNSRQKNRFLSKKTFVNGNSQTIAEQLNVETISAGLRPIDEFQRATL